MTRELAAYTTWQAKPLPKGAPRFRKPQQCYRNAQMAAMDGRWPHLVYAEGAALGPRSGAWVEHAWLVDTTDDLVVDSTWHPLVGAKYCGRVIPTQEVVEFLVSSGRHNPVDINFVIEVKLQVLGFNMRPEGTS